MFFEILNRYLDERVVKINEDEIFQNSQSNISVNPYLGSILSFFIRIFDVKKVLELGALYGKSAILMASCADEIVVHSIENNESNYDIASRNVEKYDLQDRVKIHFGDAMNLLNSQFFQNENFDMAFIDANKLAYMDYLKWCERYLRKNSILVFDNIFIHYALPKYRDENCQMYRKMEEFLEYTKDNNLFERMIIPYERDGVCILMGR